MSRVTVDFSNSDRFRRHVRDAVQDGLAMTGEHMRGSLKRNFGSEGGTRVGDKKFVSSPPGAFPGVRTSRLSGSIARTDPKRGLFRRNRFRVRVGTNVEYGLHLEKGTRYMAPRPWLLRTLLAEKANLNRTFSRTAARSLAAKVIR